MKRLFESRKRVTAMGAPDARIIFTKAPFIQYQQFLLEKNFRQYIETIMVSKKILHMGFQKTPIQKTYEISVGTNSLNIEFYGSNRQSDLLELSLVNDKSDKHLTIYDSCNLEKAVTLIKSLAMEDFTEANSLADKKKYDVDNNTQKKFLLKQFVAWSCDGCSLAPLSDYINISFKQRKNLSRLKSKLRIYKRNGKIRKN